MNAPLAFGLSPLGLRAAVALGSLLAAGGLPAAEPATPAVAVRLELTDGSLATGDLAAVDEAVVRLRADGGERAFALRQVRRIVREPAAAAAPRQLVVLTSDGGRLAGDDFRIDGERALVAVGHSRIELPAERVQTIAWIEPGQPEPAWLGEVPERPEADLVVIRRDEGQAFVACAVVGVSPESVTVVLDGETIPVKREKVAGVVWLREPRDPPGGILVSLPNGQLAAGRVAWSPEGLVLDADLRLPADAFATIDFAAGRSVPLAAIPPERSQVEPFFGSLAAVEGLAAFFAPRTLADANGRPGAVIVRPRTEIAWPVPLDSRRFHARLRRDSPADSQTGSVEVRFKVDDREVYRKRIGRPEPDGDEAGEPVEFDVAGGRRLTMTVDFVAGDMGCGVRISEGAFEK